MLVCCQASEAPIEVANMTETKVLVKGVGAHLPGEKVTGNAIDDYLGTIPGVNTAKYYRIIEKMAGIKYRHFSLAKHSGQLLEDSAHLGYRAAALALDRAGMEARDLDVIITTTSTPPYLRPGMAKQIRNLLGNDGCSTYDLWGACTGIQQAITLATGGIRAGIFRNALLIGVEVPSTTGRAENYAADKITRYDMLLRGALGDGAGALVLSGSHNPAEEDGVLYTRSGTEGDHESVFHRQAGGSTLPLNIKTFGEGLHHWHHDFETLRQKGRAYFVEIVKRTLRTTDIPIARLDFIVPAAANFGYFRADDYLEGATHDDRLFWHDMVDRIFTNFSAVGNIPSAAIYVALNELYERGKLQNGKLVLLPSVEGATWGWGASLLRWNGGSAALCDATANAAIELSPINERRSAQLSGAA